MHDEATPHYIDLIDQTTLGHQFILREFGQTPRVGWQIDPFGHSAVQAYLLGAEVFPICLNHNMLPLPFISHLCIVTIATYYSLQLGFDSLFFARIDYQDRAIRLRDKTLEVIWQGSKSLASSSQVSTFAL